jgi:hypothetical protein
VVDALSRKCLLLQEFRVKMLGFDDLRDMYADDQILRRCMKQLRIQFLEIEALG